jgi:Arm DNA-binding domain
MHPLTSTKPAKTRVFLCFLRSWERRTLRLTCGGNWPDPKGICPQIPLTDAAARNAKPAAKTVRMFDRDGLHLEVSPRGGKWWRRKYRYAGKEKRVSLGVYPATDAVRDIRRRS